MTNRKHNGDSFKHPIEKAKVQLIILVRILWFITKVSIILFLFGLPFLFIGVYFGIWVTFGTLWFISFNVVSIGLLILIVMVSPQLIRNLFDGLNKGLQKLFQLVDRKLEMKSWNLGES